MASFIHDRLVEMGNTDPAVAFRAYRQIEDAVTRASAPGQDQKAAALADELAEELISKTEPTKNKKGRDIPSMPVHSAEVRGKICRLMAYVAGAEQVPALVAAMEDLDVREMARWALDRNTSSAATDALVEALKAVGPRFRAGVVNALAYRKDDQARRALINVAQKDSVPEIRLLAIEGLSRFADGDSAATVMMATSCKEPNKAVRAYRAALRLAGNYEKAGKKEEAAGLYRMIRSSGAPEAQKSAARRAMEAAQ